MQYALSAHCNTSCKGAWPAGDWQVEIDKRPGGVMAVISDVNQGVTLAPELQPLPRQFAVSVCLSSLVVEVWDDERCRLSGRRQEWRHTPGKAAARGTRLFAITIDDMRLEVLRYQTPSRALLRGELTQATADTPPRSSLLSLQASLGVLSVCWVQYMEMLTKCE